MLMKKLMLALFCLLGVTASMTAATPGTPGKTRASASGTDNYEWVKLTSESQLSDGLEVIIAATGNDYAMSTTQNTNNRAAAVITRSGDNLSLPLGNDVAVLTLGKVEDGGTTYWTFYDGGTNKGYLYAASSSSNHLKTESTANDNAYAKITVSSGETSIVFSKSNFTRNVLLYNTSKLFACYSSTVNNTKAVELYYKKTNSGDDPVVETPSAPTFSIDGVALNGENNNYTYEFTGSASVTITGAEDGELIYYTTNTNYTNSESVFNNGTVFSNSISVSENATIQAVIVMMI